jgi:hypothetical protein
LSDHSLELTPNVAKQEMQFPNWGKLVIGLLPIGGNVPQPTPVISFHRKIFKGLNPDDDAQTIAQQCIHNPL